jgi:glutaminyl-peptide cyclotransferase
MFLKSLLRFFYSFLFIILICLFPLTLHAIVEQLVPVVISKHQHELPAFTQGLAIGEDQLYESTGLYGQSSLRHLDILTGKVLKLHSLSSDIFAEGLAAFPKQLLHITWKEQQAFIYDLSSLKPLETLFYSGEGWGLCRDENTVWMSNGTERLTQRNFQTFAVLKTLSVKWMGHSLKHLNDLECVGNDLYANVWPTNFIVRINKVTGDVTGVIDCSQLLSPQEKKTLTFNEVLNGIAHRSKTETFFLTGKGWPWIFEVRFVPQKKINY